jgi:hypothetical protein
LNRIRRQWVTRSTPHVLCKRKQTQPKGSVNSSKKRHDLKVFI